LRILNDPKASHLFHHLGADCRTGRRSIPTGSLRGSLHGDREEEQEEEEEEEEVSDRERERETKRGEERDVYDYVWAADHVTITS